jgi:hypothetical protein
MTDAGEPVPEPIHVTALIGTGTRGSVIKQGTADRLRLELAGPIPIYSATRLYEVRPGYEVRLVAGALLRWRQQLSNQHQR